MTLLRMDNVLLVVTDLEAAIAFFTELGMELEGRMVVEGPWVDRTIGIDGARSEIATMRTPDGHGRIELDQFLTPAATVPEPGPATVNALGYRRVMFAVTDLDDVIARLQRLGAEVVDEVVQYEDVYRLCYMRGPDGILVGLAEELAAARPDPEAKPDETFDKPADR
jgi:catechol 2,3-dioxygenase-like lactoylglutathione lyase family enzyme